MEKSGCKSIYTDIINDVFNQINRKYGYDNIQDTPSGYGELIVEVSKAVVNKIKDNPTEFGLKSKLKSLEIGAIFFSKVNGIPNLKIVLNQYRQRKDKNIYTISFRIMLKKTAIYDVSVEKIPEKRLLIEKHSMVNDVFLDLVSKGLSVYLENAKKGL